MKRLVVSSYNFDFPEKLYHATFKVYLDSIKKHGLLSKSPNINWEGLSIDAIYLSDDPESAESFCEVAEVSDEVWNSGIIIFEINTSDLNLDLLDEDENILDEIGSYVYFGNIPFSKLTVYSEE